MISRAQTIRLAFFFLVGFAILITIFILLLGAKLTEKRDFYKIEFDDTSVAGLQIGGAVLYRGIRIGRIEDIAIDRERITNIIVTISVKQDTPIKTDQVATLVMVGITGLKQIEITGGTDNAPFLAPGGSIQAGRSLFDNISQTAEVLTAKIESVIDNIIHITNKENQDRIDSILHSVDVMLSESHRPIINTMVYIEDITSELAIATVKANNLLAKLDSAIDEEQLANIITNAETISANLAQVDGTQITDMMERLTETINRTNILMTRVDGMVHKSSPDIVSTISELRETIENLNEFTRLITEDPSILLRGVR
jgi:phospholipid/cholesterol/gamma-HCH transport system substrate-binding protein